MKQFVLTIVALLLSGCAVSPPGVVLGGAKQASDTETIQLAVQHLTIYQPAIQKFVLLAAQSDIEELMKLFAPAMKASMGEERLRNELREVVVPFFADHAELFGGASNPATFPDGRKGIANYTYIMTRTGIKKPFTIWLLVEGNQALVGFLEVNRCIPGRHPICDGQIRTE